MNVKTDTKEKFTVITPIDEVISANMTDNMQTLLGNYLQQKIPHLVLNFTNVATLDIKAAEMIAQMQQNFYANNFSMVICCLQPAVETFLDENEILETLNVTPTESEAWDIVQMEEIEREFLDDF